MADKLQRPGCAIPTRWHNGRWALDLDCFEQAARQPNSRVFVLCSPMNPCGSVYQPDELQQIIALAEQHNLMILSDEIHADLVLDAAQPHCPIAKLMGEGHPQVITFMSASKTFNVAGLGCAFAVVANAALRQRFRSAVERFMGAPNLLGQLATQAAFSQASDWHQALLGYLRGNRDLWVQAINAIDGLRTHANPATFLSWIQGDANSYRRFQQVGILPSNGQPFGDAHCVRVNFACPHAGLQQAIERLQDLL